MKFRRLSLLQQSREKHACRGGGLSDFLSFRDRLQQGNPAGRQRIPSYMAPTVECNPTTFSQRNPIRDEGIRRLTTGDVAQEQA